MADQPKNSEREQTQAVEEWGERVATGRSIARGGKETGHVPGAVESTDGANPPEDASARFGDTAEAVADVLAQLGDDADPKRVAEAVKAQSGLDLDPGEVTTIRDTLRKQA